MTEFKSIKELENHTSDGICRELILNQTLAIIKLIEDKISKGYDDEPNQLKELIKTLKGET